MSGRVTRGIRNNNPGNIKIGAPWEGLMPREMMNAHQLAEKVFCVFLTAPYGIRPIARVLITYQDKRRAADGSRIDTVREIIERWAPTVENNTDSYVAHLRHLLDVDEGEKIDVKNWATMWGLVTGIITHENGCQPYTDAQIEQGLILAGLTPPARSIHKSKTVKAAKVATPALTAAAVLSEVSKTLDVVEGPLATFTAMAKSYGVLVVVAIALAAIGYMVYRRWDDHRRLGR